VWSLVITIWCVASVAVALWWRIDYGRRDPLGHEKRAAAAAATREIAAR
jgi:hypothetical protein